MPQLHVAQIKDNLCVVIDISLQKQCTMFEQPWIKHTWPRSMVH
jgi:hypothetical protein